MKRSLKAVLLSALVLPGAGHIYLKKYLPGAVLIGASFAAAYYLFSKSLEMAVQIADKIQGGDIQPDVEAITELVANQQAGSDAQLLNIATAVFIICWLVGIIDSFRIASAREKNDQGSDAG